MLLPWPTGRRLLLMSYRTSDAPASPPSCLRPSTEGSAFAKLIGEQVRLSSDGLLIGEAGVNPALSRSGDGKNFPKSDYRPAATTMEAIFAHRGCA
jgi:hypothetical protein